MCGHVGIAGTIENKHVSMFNDLLIFNIPRGKDSTGIASVDRDAHRKNLMDKDTYLIKAPVNAVDIQEFNGYRRVVNTGKFCIIGHGRHATVGKVNKSNAHPFEFSEIIGAHNGTVPTHSMPKVPNKDQFGTDSEAIISAINDLGVEEVIKEISGGAWALVWYDKTDASINFLRNGQRPFIFGLLDDKKSLVWASESDMIHAACGRNGIESSGNLFHLPENQWYKFFIPIKSGDKFEDPIIHELKGKETPVANHYRSTGDNFSQQRRPMVGVGSDARLPTLKEARVTRVDKSKKGRVVKSYTYVIGWDEKRLSETEFRNRTGETCAYSDDIVTFEDVVQGREKIVFIDQNTFVKAEFNNPMNHMWYGLEYFKRTA